MTELCSTCLSSDRHLTPISFLREVLAFINWTDVKWNMNGDKVCWECLALLKRVESFKRQVLLAQKQLSMYRNNAQPTISLKCMSTLSACSMCEDVKLSPLLIDIKVEAEESESCTGNNFEKSSIKIEYDENNENNDNILIEHNETNLIKQEEINPKEIDELISSENDEPADNNIVVNEKDSDEETNNTIDKFIVVPMTLDEMLEARDLEKERHMYKKSPYKCVTCLKGFFNEVKLEKHNSIKHHAKMGPHICSICEERFNQVDKHSLHYEIHFRRYQCRECEFRHHRLDEIQKHVDRIHLLKNYDCSVCDKSFTTPGQRNYHTTSCHKERPTCDTCGKTCTNTTNLKLHMAKHGGPKEQCPHCGKYYKVLKQHLKMHTPPDARRDEAYCAECDIQFRSLYIYRSHLKNHSKHRDPTICKKYSCDRCDTKFRRKPDLVRHITYIHDKGYPFFCDYCNKGFYRKNLLAQHISEKHLGIQRPKDNICTYCGKGFKDKTVLKSHLRIHTGEKPFKCNFCPWRFTHNGTLFTHMRLKHPEANVVKKKEKTVEKKNKIVKKKEKS